MEFSEPSAIGVAFLAVAAVYVIVREVVVPKIKGDRDQHTRPDHPFYCQVNKYESRISKLESRCVSNDDNIKRLEDKIDANSAKIDKVTLASLAVQSDLSHVREIVEWIKRDRENGGS